MYATDRNVLRKRVLDLMGRMNMGRRQRPRAVFDPVRVEAEMYNALYGPRSGTVDNIIPRSRGDAGRREHKRAAPRRRPR